MIEGISTDSWLEHLCRQGLHFVHLSISPSLSWLAAVGFAKGMEVVGCSGVEAVDFSRVEAVGFSGAEAVETVDVVHQLLEQ
jgi:hypothetical protein